MFGDCGKTGGKGLCVQLCNHIAGNNEIMRSGPFRKSGEIREPCMNTP